MRKTAMAVAAAALMSVGTAFAGVNATLELDRAWLGQDDDLAASVTITNDSARVLMVPRWLVPGERLDSNLFDVRRDGMAVEYLGILAKRGAPSRSDFVALAPGRSLTGRTELTRHYDISDGGEYTVAFRGDLLDGVQASELMLASQAIESETLAFYRDAPLRDRIAFDAQLVEMAGSLSFTNCSSSQQSGASSAKNGATSYSTGAKNYLQSKTWNTVGPRYTTWFGATDSNRFNTVSSHFVSIENAFLNAPIVIDCSCTQNYYAYVYPTQPYKIYVCNAFWSAPQTGTDSKAGTLVHEMSHFNVVAGTDDWAYGQTACKNLAKKKATRAIDNADSHEYFAENTPSQN